MNLTELLDQSASRWPGKSAIVEGAQIVSYKVLAERSIALAEQIAARGIAAGDRVGLCFPNSVNYVALTFALWRLEAVVVPIPIECPPQEIEEMAREMGVKAILSQRAPSLGTPAYSAARPAAELQLAGEDAGAPREGQMHATVALGNDCFLSIKDLTEPPDNHGLNLAFIRFTSGTTNARKGVALCHETIRDRIVAANRGLNVNLEDTVMWCLPMSHHFLVTILLYLSQGATILLARHVLARPFLDATNQWRGTILYAAPFHFALLARDTSGLALDTVRLAVSTTCALPSDLPAAFSKRFGRPLVQGLGIIELGLVCLNTDDPAGRWNSVGRALPDYQVRILSPDSEGCGEVQVRGPGFFDAYAAPWVSREQVLPEGWFTTGDLGWLDAEGFLFLAGRKTAVINLAGRKVFPEAVEAVLNRHPVVRESRVYGRQHPQLGEVVEADLVLNDGPGGLDSVRAFCRDNLASYEIPTRLNVVPALPRTAVTGKLLRPSNSPLD